MIQELINPEGLAATLVVVTALDYPTILNQCAWCMNFIHCDCDLKFSHLCLRTSWANEKPRPRNRGKNNNAAQALNRGY